MKFKKKVRFLFLRYEKNIQDKLQITVRYVVLVQVVQTSLFDKSKNEMLNSRMISNDLQTNCWRK